MIKNLIIILVVILQMVASFITITICLFPAIFCWLEMVGLIKEGIRNANIIGMFLEIFGAILWIILICGGSLMCMIGLLFWIYSSKDIGIRKIISDYIKDYKKRNDMIPYK